ncbi:hypothetical protein F3Y22_tig00110940pilonHSYRG00307 [Hibiscus syriacus]|uniref:Uncharacterized protein n=1 Tax=Hibiscus syriacus TaxID=106335 RepID=A0A6A2ZCI6_HIBSY|nr:hypothetical protein F3Y22_tig00110940pilonHSYRG00307 [Hibiscus syriacus]
MDFGLAGLMTSSDATLRIRCRSSRIELAKPLEVNAGEEGFKGHLVDWINHLSNTGRINDAIDKDLIGKGHDEEMLQFLKIASNCVVSRPQDRWSMFQVYQSLETMAEENGFSEMDDDFPLIFSVQDNESM